MTLLRRTSKLQHKAVNRRPVRPCIELLEDRTVPSVTASVRTIREATAAGPESAAQAGIQAIVDAFRADLGDPNNGNAVGSQAAGRRQITWDGADNDSAPARLPADFFNSIAPRGAIFTGDARLQFQVSADSANPTATIAEFGNVNATYPTAFATFSSPRLFTALTNNVYEVEFVVPGTLTRATVSGFGAVFTDVDVAGSTKIEFFDVNGQEIFERNVLATAGNESLSFLGVTFVGAPLARVRLTAGNAVIGPNDVTQGGTSDIVVFDDFIYGEPKPLNAPRVAVGGGSGGQVAVFNAATGAQLTLFRPYGTGFIGPVSVAMGDVNGDGRDDIITGTAAGAGAAPHIKVFDGNSFAEIRSFFAFTPAFTGGVSVGAGNVNGDAFADILVSAAGGGAGPHVKVINGATSTQVQADGQITAAAELASFYAFGPGFMGGVVVAAADINGDFRDDVIVGTATQATHTVAVNATQLNSQQSNGQINNAALLRSFFAFQGFAGGVSVAGGDVNGDGRADIIVGAGPGAGPHVKVFSGIDNAELRSFFAQDPTFTGGVRVSAANFSELDSLANIITGQGTGGGLVRYIGVEFPLRPIDLEPFGTSFTGGVFVAGSRFSIAVFSRSAGVT